MIVQTMYAKGNEEARTLGWNKMASGKKSILRSMAGEIVGLAKTKEGDLVLHQQLAQPSYWKRLAHSWQPFTQPGF